MKIIYRPEVDALRAIAVISVIIYHAQIKVFNYQLFQGGFLGVDIFFVISGYLITSLIFKELTFTGKLSLNNFYQKRIRRILPALLFVMISSLPFAWVFLFPNDFVDFAKSILSSLGFFSNFYFHYSGLIYGSEDGLLKPFLHLWSLSIEEQYYFFFPLLLLICFKYFRKYIFFFLIIFFFISIIFADWGSRNFFSFTFYSIHSRIWEFIAGSLVAYLEINLKEKKNSISNSIFVFTGLLFIGYSIFFYNEKDIHHPSIYTLIPIVGTCLILWFSNKQELITKILSFKLFVAIGLISYSLYLWHYPLLAFARISGFFYENDFKKLLLLFLLIIFSVTTYFIIERPFRNKIYSFKLIFFIILINFIILAVVSFIIIMNNGFVNRLIVKEKFQEQNTYLYLSQDGEPCFGRKENFCQFGSGEKKIILLGDSHLASLSFDLHNRIKNQDYKFLPITNAGYFHFRDNVSLSIGTKKINQDYLNLNNRIEEILNSSRNNIIILGGATSLYFYKESIRPNRWHSEYVDRNSAIYAAESLEKDFLNFIQDLSINNDIILLYPIPEPGRDLKKKNFKNTYIKNFNFYYNDFLKVNNRTINLFDNINSAKVRKVYPYKIFCSSSNNKCLTHNQDNYFFFDGFHPSLKGAEMINDLIVKEINNIKENRF